jgi:hypothetical protein
MLHNSANQLPSDLLNYFELRRKLMPRLIGLFAFVLATATLWGQQIPAGTLLPVMLDNTLDSDKSKPGEAVSAKLRQDVPLPEGAKIKRNSKVLGHVVAVSRASSGDEVSLTIQFDHVQIDKKSVPVSVGLRALASMQLVAQAKQPANLNAGMGGTSVWDQIMSQIGGQIAYNGQKIVKAPNGQVVGRVVQPGAIMGVPLANPALGCAAPANNTEQAFWVFSTDACGIYDEKDMTYVSGIGGANSGKIVLKAPKSVEVRVGSGWLLQVN